MYIIPEVKLLDVHPIPPQSQSSAVCNIPQSQTAHCRAIIEHFADLWLQTAHCRAIIEHFADLWLLLKGQSGEIFLGVNTSIIKEKI